MGITFSPNNQPDPSPALFSKQVQGLVNKTGQLSFRLEKLEHVVSGIFESMCETLDRLKALEQHNQWRKDTGPLAKKIVKKTPQKKKK